MTRCVTCPECGNVFRLPDAGAGTVVETACWECSVPLSVDQYRNVVVEVGNNK